MSAILIFIVWISICLAQIDQEENLQNILQKHHKAVNLDLLLSIKSLEKKGKVNFYLNEQNFEKGESNLYGTYLELIQLPDQRYFKSSFDQTIASYEQCVNGSKSWVKDGGGYRSTELNKSEQLTFSLDFNLIPHLIMEEKNPSHLKYCGKTAIEDKKYYCISMQTEEGNNLYYYLDVDSYLVGIVSYMIEFSENDEWAIRYYNDYKFVHSLPFPHIQVNRMKFGNDWTTMVYHTESIAIDKAIDISIFEMPENQ